VSAAGGARATAGLALRLTLRELRAGELRVLLAALTVASAAIAAVSLFTARMDRALERGASELLGADLVVSSQRPIDPAVEAAARAAGLATAATLTFRSVVLAGERMQLVEVKAVGPGYPLRGRLALAETPFGPARPVTAIPPPGTAWPDSRLAAAFDLAPGASLRLGRAELRVAALLAAEPDRGAELLSIGPRLMIRLADVPATGLVQPGSRVRYRLLLAGPPGKVAALRERLAGREELRLEGVGDARPGIRTALERGRRFLGLAAMVSVLLAAIAVALAAHRHAERHLDAAAVLRCLGASQRRVLALYLAGLGLLWLLAALAGSALGWLAQALLARLLAGFAFAALPAPPLAALAAGPLAALAVLVGFALAPIARLRSVPPGRVLRRELGPAPARAWSGPLAAVAVIAALVRWQSGDALLAGWVLAGTAAATALLVGCAFALVRALAPLRRRVGVAWRFGLANVARRQATSVVQITAFGLGLMLLLLLTVVRTELLAQWRASIPADAPNYFLINVLPGEVEALDRFLAERGLRSAGLYPLVRARLEAIDGRPVEPEGYRAERARNLARHEFNLSWSESLPADNRLLAGRWWGPADRGQARVSVERGFAEALGFGRGARLAFRVGAERLEVEVASIREVRWDSMRPNFFVLAAPGLLDALPATYITSLHVPDARVGVLRELVARFPSVTVLDLVALLGKVREIIDQAARAIEYVLAFTLLAGLTVLLAALQATLDERRRETAVIRTLGGDRRRLLQGLAAEFATLGAAAGAIAAGAASLAAALLARQVFDLAYSPGALVWVAGIGAGTLGVGAAGLLAARQVLDAPPRAVLEG